MLAPTPLALVQNCSLYASRLIGAKPALAREITELVYDPYTAEAIERDLAREYTDDAELLKTLRECRQRVFLRTMARDLCGLADLREVCTTMTLLAEASIRRAVAYHHKKLAEQFGEPLDALGKTPQRMIVVGMGKLGGGELNVSSDVDLVFLYPESGDTAGQRQISNHEFFDRLGRRLVSALHDITTDGFVFRVDTRLRPYGESGPLTCSLAMLEQYLLDQGRAWERYAWLKARVVAGGNEEAVNALVRPFVFRKYLDFDAYASLRDLHEQISEQVRRRDLYDNIKLGPGGIREIEFIVQVFQLVRGGREPWLRERATLPMFERLSDRGLLPVYATTELRLAYIFLRTLEHRLQYRDDRQTHNLPGSDVELDLLSSVMGHQKRSEFLAELTHQRRNVSRHFENAFEDTSIPTHRDPLSELWETPDLSRPHSAALEELGYRDPQNLLKRLQAMRVSTRYEHLPARSKDRVDALMPIVLKVSAQYTNVDETCERLINLLEAISRRSAYLALLAEHPPMLPRVAHMVSASSWAAEYLTLHPILLDELLDPRLLFAPPDRAQWRAEIALALTETQGNDTERQMDALRHFKHSQTFRLLAQDLEGTMPITEVSDQLSDLADVILDATLSALWARLSSAPSMPPFALIAYGKLGGRELGYASDLDLIFLYDDPEEEAAQRYVRLAQGIIAWLSSTTGAGKLYDVDIRLRPDGESGLLVSRFDAFLSYQQKQAWSWEHQALTRARFCAGDPDLGGRFEKERVAILRLPRQRGTLRSEVLAMREKMYRTHGAAPGQFDLKHDRGGMIDIEFIVQYLVLNYSAAFPELTANLGNIALLEMAARLELIEPVLAAAVAHAYRSLRAKQHELRLNGMNRARVPSSLFAKERADVQHLWAAVFGTEESLAKADFR